MMSDELPSRDDLPSRLGKAMIFGAWIVGIALLVMFFQDLLDRQHNPNRDPVRLDDGQAGVVLQRNRMGHYVASGEINGEPVTFLLDTGATSVALPLTLARRLGLKLLPGGISKTANGMVETWSTRLDSVGLGGLVVRNVRAAVLPNMPGDDVLLGMGYLRHFELIQRDDTLTVRRPL
jgi:aspartyl protease family protein